MKNKIEELLKVIDNKDQKKIQDFLNILSDMKLSDDKKLEGLLYIQLKDGKISLDEIKEKYDENILNSVEVLRKLDNINYSQQDIEAENIRKMFFAITKDIRIIMLKIAIVVTDLRHLEHFSDEEKLTLANSIFSLFAPLAARLGLSTYKTELENGAFMLKDKKLYDEIQAKVDSRFHKRQPIVERLTTLVQNCMKDLGIQGKVYGRKKHIYSIYKKLQNHSLDNIYDLVAVRALVQTIPDCYALLGRLHSMVEPYKNRFKDYISTPKPNGYQSLHTTVLFEGFPVEIQIRTEEMHQYAEYGVAAHWLYKEKKNKQDNLDVRLAWLRQMMENEDVSIDELASSLGQDIYNNEIFVQTPKGKVIYLPSGSTPIDFAYSIHSEVGNKCVGAKVNGKMVQTHSELHNGDVVEIITNPNSKGPSRDWLKICKTAEARSKINSFLKKNMKEETIKLGKTMLEGAIKEKGYSISKLMQNGLEEILKQYNYTEENELFANIGTGAIPPKGIANKLASLYQKQVKATIESPERNTSITLAEPAEKQIDLKGLNNILLKFANCCHPMYGDDIIGFISAGRGIIIHRKVCPNISYFRESRLIEAFWKPIEEQQKKKK
ncbi:MAG: bifunctional (p)ppGpp synthetase/guanosine-3',5'-bis(diphosphate) 3'-pyrophosphohydrolase [Clostridia bacterium]|nr:bifunctional (p)ppGpp synthetase/guanosine-3',5'-bis(diphosphate) 3'-pyrophosphohydrolase [Clostridia bacterium]